GGFNLYGFVGNDPVNGVDVLGMAGYCDQLRNARLKAQFAAAVYPELEEEFIPAGWAKLSFI
ncbi:MAG: hypothetical protein KDC45_14090, partial [Bacteroidetes bacterium]|nr:hypothetical protein [Bacteroidota bacterium]